MAINSLQIPGYQLGPDANFAPLSQLGEIYRNTQNRQKLSELGRGLSDGAVDYRSAASQVADMGSSDAMFKFLALAEAKDKQKLEQAAATQFGQFLGGIGGGGAHAPMPAGVYANAASQSVPAVGSPQPAGARARAPVMPSSKVWGDAEAEAAGLYEPSAPRPAQQPMSLASVGGAYAPSNMPTPTGPGSNTRSIPTTSASQMAPQRVAQAGPDVVSAAGQPTPFPQAGGGLNLNASHIPQLAAFYSNPNVPAAQRELSGKLLAHVLDQSKPNEKLQYLQQLKASSGYKGTPLELEMELRRAGKAEINIDQKGETEEAKAAGKAAGERRATMFASAGAASKTLQNLSRMEGLLDQVSQGRLSPATMSVSAWAKALGVNDDVATSLGLDPKGVGSAQAVQSLINESVVGKIGAGGFPANNFSDADRAFITDIFPKLSNDPRGNKIMIESARRMARLDQERARDFQKFKANPSNKGKGFEDFEVEYSDRIARQDMFGDLRKQAEAIVGAPRGDIGGTFSNPDAAPRQPRSSPPPMQGARQAPDGNWYIQQNGKTYRVD